MVEFFGTAFMKRMQKRKVPLGGQDAARAPGVVTVSWGEGGLAAGATDGRVRVVAAGFLERVAVDLAAGAWVNAVAWSPVEPRLACGSDDALRVVESGHVALTVACGSEVIPSE